WVAGMSGAITGPLLCLAGMLGLRVVATAVGGVVLLVDLVLLISRWWSLRTPRKEERARDSRYGLLIAALTAWVICLATAPLLLRDVFDIHVGFDGRHLWSVRGLALSAAALAAVVHVSAMVDWGVIRLRLLGILGDASLPCQSGRNRSSNWRLLTRIWLGHRVAAYVLGRIALAAIISFGVAGAVIGPASSPRPAYVTAKENASVKPPLAGASAGTQLVATAPRQQVNSSGSSTTTQPVLAALATVAAAILVFFINRFLPMWSLISNPRLSVGDRIVLAEEYGTGVRERPVYYVVDVAVEGIKLLELDDDDRPLQVESSEMLQLNESARSIGPARREPAREHDRSLALVDAPRLLRFRGRYTGCDLTCSKAYHACPLKFGEIVRRPPPNREGDPRSDERPSADGAAHTAHETMAREARPPAGGETEVR